jgi:hypothetical protein
MYIKTNRAPRLATALRLRRGLLTPTVGLPPIVYVRKQTELRAWLPHCACAGDCSPRQWGCLPLYMYENKQSSALGYRTALAQGIAHPDVGSPHLFPRGQWNSYLHWESFSSISTGCPHLKRARWSSLRPGVFLLWYVSFSNFQLTLVVSDKGGISAREFLSPMRSAQIPTHLFRLARSS